MDLRKTFIALLLLLIVPFAFAHERHSYRIGEDTYHFVIGSLGEPVHVGDKTGIDLRVSLADPKDPMNTSAKGVTAVAGLEETLQAEILHDGETLPVILEGVWGTAGSYKAHFIPMETGTYGYRIHGEIDGVPVDLAFACNPAGHAMHAAAPDLTQRELSPGVMLLSSTGGFGCPSARELLQIPATQKDHTAGIALALGIAALVVSLLAWRRPKKRR
jgi:hypothetical protein